MHVGLQDKSRRDMAPNRAAHTQSSAEFLDFSKNIRGLMCESIRSKCTKYKHSSEIGAKESSEFPAYGNLEYLSGTATRFKNL
jgi:hypothetical protein